MLRFAASDKWVLELFNYSIMNNGNKYRVRFDFYHYENEHSFVQ